MKICTSIIQSQQLLKLGLDPKTADMLWIDDGFRLGIINNFDAAVDESDIPAWSLSALLGQLPIYVVSQFGNYHLNIERKEKSWKCGYCFYSDSPLGEINFMYSFVEDSFPAIEKPELMDAVYEMTINYLKYVKNFLLHYENY